MVVRFSQSRNGNPELLLQCTFGYICLHESVQLACRIGVGLSCFRERPGQIPFVQPGLLLEPFCLPLASADLERNPVAVKVSLQHAAHGFLILNVIDESIEAPQSVVVRAELEFPSLHLFDLNFMMNREYAVESGMRLLPVKNGLHNHPKVLIIWLGPRNLRYGGKAENTGVPREIRPRNIAIESGSPFAPTLDDPIALIAIVYIAVDEKRLRSLHVDATTGINAPLDQSPYLARIPANAGTGYPVCMVSQQMSHPDMRISQAQIHWAVMIWRVGEDHGLATGHDDIFMLDVFLTLGAQQNVMYDCPAE